MSKKPDLTRRHQQDKWLERDIHHGLPRAEDPLPAVYVVMVAGVAIYVGVSNNLRQRLRQHSFQNHYDGHTSTPWGDFRWGVHPVKIKVKYPRRYGAHLMLEARLIRRLKPQFNVRGVA